MPYGPSAAFHLPRKLDFAAGRDIMLNLSSQKINRVAFIVHNFKTFTQNTVRFYSLSQLVSSSFTGVLLQITKICP